MGEPAKVLCVDDEPQVLEGLQHVLRGRVTLRTATSGEEALAILTKEGPFAVVVSDMRMPKMDGAVLLASARTLAPDTTRMLLTGHSDLTSAIAAVNEGGIFRFLTKPCPPQDLRSAVEAAVHQHELVVGERVLLEQTLQGAVATLSDVLSISLPGVYGRVATVRRYVSALATGLGLARRWELELAGSLYAIGCVAMDHAIAERAFGPPPLGTVERKLLAEHPEVGYRLITRIPRLSNVAAIVRAQRPDAGMPDGDAELVRAVSALRFAIGVEARVFARDPLLHAVRATQDELGSEPACAETLARAEAPAEVAPIAVHVGDLIAGMILAANATTKGGMIVAAAGTALSPVLVERLRQFSLGVGLTQPLLVFVRRAGA